MSEKDIIFLTKYKEDLIQMKHNLIKLEIFSGFVSEQIDGLINMLTVDFNIK